MAAHLPPGLPPGAGDPLRWAVAGTVARLIVGGTGAAAAERDFAAALVEYLAENAGSDARLPDAVRLGAQMARGRAALRADG